MNGSEDSDSGSSTDYGNKSPLKIAKKKGKITIKTNLPLLIIKKKDFNRFKKLMSDAKTILSTLE